MEKHKFYIYISSTKKQPIVTIITILLVRTHYYYFLHPLLLLPVVVLLQLLLLLLLLLGSAQGPRIEGLPEVTRRCAAPRGLSHWLKSQTWLGECLAVASVLQERLRLPYSVRETKCLLAALKILSLS